MSVVLIEARKTTRNALPVLSRGPVDVSTGKDFGVFVNPSILPPFTGIDHPPKTAEDALLGTWTGSGGTLTLGGDRRYPIVNGFRG